MSSIYATSTIPAWLESFQRDVPQKGLEEAVKPVLSQLINHLALKFPARFTQGTIPLYHLAFPGLGRRPTPADTGKIIARTLPLPLPNSPPGCDWSYVYNIKNHELNNLRLENIRNDRLVVKEPVYPTRELRQSYNDTNWATVEEIDQYVKMHFLALAQGSPKVNGANQQAPVDLEEKSKEESELKTAEPTVTEEETWDLVEPNSDTPPPPQNANEQPSQCNIQ